MAETSNCWMEERSVSSARKGRRRKTHLVDLALLPSIGDTLRSLLLSLDSIREEVGDKRRNGRRRLTEARSDLKLRLVHLLGALLLLVLEDGLEVVLGTVKKRNTDVRLLEGSDVVRSVSGHEGDVTERFEGSQNELLLRRRDTGVDPGVLNELVPRFATVGVLLESGAGHADVVLFEKRGVERVGGVDGDDSRLVGGAPSKLYGTRSVSFIRDRWKNRKTHRLPSQLLPSSQE
jgi:hypothetical protein